MKMPAVLIVIVLLPLTAMAHPGKTDRQGGHKCYKECAEWDLYYAEYHLHDKDGKAVKVARKKTVRQQPEDAPVGEIAVRSTDSPAEATLSPPIAVAAAAGEPDIVSLPWILLMLFLLLFLVVRRNRRKSVRNEAGRRIR